MKPKTKFQKSIVEMSGQIPFVTKAQQEWAYQNCLTHIARRTPRGKTTCMECAHEWSEPDVRKTECVCPVCGTKLSIENTLQRKFREASYMLIHTTFNGHQVMRYFFLSVDRCIGYKANYFFREVVQQWIAPNGKHATIALSRSMGFYFDLWSFGSQMELRSNLDIYNRLPHLTYPKRRYIAELKRGGFKGRFHNIRPHDYFVNLLADSRFETMLKAGYTDLFRYFNNNTRKLNDYWPSIRIAIRNGFKIKDAGIWIDYLNELRYFDKDLRNPHYVCPADLRGEHDSYCEKHRRIREAEWARQAEEREEQKRRKEIETQARFDRLKAWFGGFEFTDGTISVRVLQSIDELQTEGRAMHHCVGGYYDRADSLILSATVGGERLATIEFSISRLMVLQCRGVCNSEVENQNQIIDLINKNATLIKRRMAA